jgi:hypothetical protein
MELLMNTVIKKSLLIMAAAVLCQIPPQAQTEGYCKNNKGPFQDYLVNGQSANALNAVDSLSNAAGNSITASKLIGSLPHYFNAFSTVQKNKIYRIILAADVPDNNRPQKVYYKKETGHVFVILQQKDTVTKWSVSLAWGFYPVHPIRSLFVRTVKCKILDNSNRQYEAAVTQQLSQQQFEAVKQQAIALTQKKYNLNRYNCYNYAVELFNAIPGVADLPLIKVRFPFFFGRGGSPCGLYKQVTQFQNQSSSFTAAVTGSFVSPAAVVNNHL